LPLLLLLPLGQSMAWKRGDLLGTAQRLYWVLGAAAAVGLILIAATVGGPVAAPLGAALGLFVILGAANEIVTRSWRPGQRLATAWLRARGLPRSIWGTALAHAGVGVTAIGIAATAWSVETIATVRLGERIAAGPYEARLDSVVPRTGPNYREEAARLTVLSGDNEIGAVETAKRVYVTRGTPTTEAGILTRGVSQVYVSFGDRQADGGVGLRLFYKPLVLLIWLGAAVMALGGAISLTDRRFRVGAPARAKAAPLAVPAE